MMEWNYNYFGDIILLINNDQWAEISYLDTGKHYWSLDVPAKSNYDVCYQIPFIQGESPSLVEAKNEILTCLKRYF